MFVKGLEDAVGTRKSFISLAQMWTKTLPAGPEHMDIKEYLRLVWLGGLGYTALLLIIHRLQATPIITIHLKP